jgi:hypothetical protein
MQQTLSKVKNLEKFIKKYGDNSLLSQTISKMMNYKIHEYNEEIKRLDKELKKFERTYKKDSSDFIREFKEGSLGDDIDFIEWSSLYQMRNRLLDKKAKLEGKN